MFDQEPQNAEAAHKYFRELNRQNKFATVLRLNKQFELDLMQIDRQGLISKQVEYARANIDVLEKIKQPLENDYSSFRNLMKTFGWLTLRQAILISFMIGACYYCFEYINIGQSMFDEKFKFDLKTAKDIKTRLSDVKGVDEIKEEVEDLIKMLKEPDQYRAKGAKLHKGVMLYGEPGTGKTLLARAIAGESGVNFIFCSGSDFDEMYAGVGAKRVRSLFKDARKHSPCIIFIDEIDSLLAGSRR